MSKSGGRPSITEEEYMREFMQRAQAKKAWSTRDVTAERGKASLSASAVPPPRSGAQDLDDSLDFDHVPSGGDEEAALVNGVSKMRVISTREAPSTRHQSGSATTARPKASIAATDGDEGDEDEDEDDEDDEDDEGNWVDVKVSSTRASKATQSQPSRPRPRPRIQPVAQAWHPSRSSSSSLNTHHHKSHKPPRTAAVTDDDVVLLENPPHTTYRKATEPARHPLPDILSQDEDEGAALIPQRKVDRRASAYHASQGRVARRGRDDAESDGPDIVEVERYEPPQPSVDESRTNRKAKGKAQRDIGVGRPPMTEVGVASANTRLYSGDHRPRAASPKRAARGSGTAESYGQNRLPRMRSRSRSDSRSPPPRRVGGGAAKARGYSDKPARSHSRSRSRSQSPRHTGGGAAGTARRYNPPHRSPSRSQSPVRATDTTAHGKRGRPRPPSPRREITVTSGARSKPRPQSPARPGKPSKTNVAAEPRDEGEGEGEWVYDEGEESGAKGRGPHKTGKERKTRKKEEKRREAIKFCTPDAKAWLLAKLEDFRLLLHAQDCNAKQWFTDEVLSVFFELFPLQIAAADGVPAEEKENREKDRLYRWMIRRCNATTPTKLDDAKTPIEYPANGQVEWLRPRKLSAKQLMRRDKIKDHAKLRQAAIDAFAKEGVEPIACRIDQKQTDLLWEQIGQEEQKKYLKQADEQRATHVNFGDQKGFAEDLVKHVEMWLSLTQRRLPAGYALSVLVCGPNENGVLKSDVIDMPPLGAKVHFSDWHDFDWKGEVGEKWNDYCLAAQRQRKKRGVGEFEGFSDPKKTRPALAAPSEGWSADRYVTELRGYIEALYDFARTPSHPRELDWSDLLSVPGDYLTSTSIPPHVERVRPIHRMDPKDVRAWYNYILHGQASEKPSFAFVFEVQDSAGEEAGGESGKNTADAGAVAGEGSDGEPDDSVAGLSGDNEAADDENNGDDVDMEAEDEADGDEVDVERGASRKRKTSASISEEHAVDEDPQPAAKKPRETGPELAQSSKGRQTSGKGKRKASEPQLSDDISEPEEAPASAALKTGGRGKAKKAPPAAPSKKIEKAAASASEEETAAPTTRVAGKAGKRAKATASKKGADITTPASKDEEIAPKPAPARPTRSQTAASKAAKAALEEPETEEPGQGSAFGPDGKRRSTRLPPAAPVPPQVKKAPAAKKK